MSYSIGDQIAEGKTKLVYSIKENPDLCILLSKDVITAGNNARSNDLEGKAAISTRTTAAVFSLLKDAGINSHFIERLNDTEIVVQRCDMVPIEWVTRRIATGSFIRRNFHVKEGLRFAPVKRECFYKDDANNDPQWSIEDVIAAKMKVGPRLIDATDIDIMSKMSELIFEVLERAWASIDCALIDMKIEFGINQSGEIVLADVIDSDSWRLWPSGDKRLMKDKQVYRDLEKVTPEALQGVKRNFEWIADRLELLLPPLAHRVVIFMGSSSDRDWSSKIAAYCQKVGVPAECRISSAHKSTAETLKILAEYEGGVPTVFIAVAGRSNGLGPVLAGNTVSLVINCPPPSDKWNTVDVWSSLRMPSGLGCVTVLESEGAAIAAANVFALSNHRVWAKLRTKQFNNWLTLKKADRDIQVKESG